MFYIVRAKLQRSSYPSIQLPNMQNHVVSIIKSWALALFCKKKKSYQKERHDQI